MICLLISLASSQVGVYVGGGPTAVVESDGAIGGGARVVVGLPAQGHAALEVSADAGATQHGAFGTARLGGRLWSRGQERSGLTLLVAGGVASRAGGATGLVHTGVGLELTGTSRVRWRVESGVDIVGDGVHAARFGVSGVFGSRRVPLAVELVEVPAAPVVEPEPATEPMEEPAASLDVEPSDALVWIPHPVCAWVPAAESGPLLAKYNGDQPVQVSAPGYMPATLQPGQTRIALERAPEQGAVVVVGWPGDVVRVGDNELAVDAAGAAVLTAPPGPLRVDVRGSGRAVALDAYVGDGMALWLPVPDPTPTLVLFDVNSATLDAQARTELSAFIAALGQGRIALAGGASPEGDAEANLALARTRAEAVRVFLVEQGVDARQIEMRSAEVAKGPPGREQRRVRIIPVENP